MSTERLCDSGRKTTDSMSEDSEGGAHFEITGVETV